MSSRALLGQLSDDDVRLLRVFRSVAEAGGLSAAELELNIGRSAISRHLKDLEIRLGVTLCRRGRGGFALTDEGRHVYESALRMLAAIDNFRSEVNEVHKKLVGNIAIALFDKTVTNPDCKIPNAIAAFNEIAPEVTLDVYVGAINEIEKGVMDGRYNIGVIPTHRTSASLAYHSLFPEQMYVYVANSHPLFDLDDDLIDNQVFKQHKFVGLGYHSPNMEVGNKIGVERFATCYDQEAVVTCILSGRYLGYLPDHYADRFVDAGLIRPINTNRFHYECDFVAITAIAPKPSRLSQYFLTCLIKAHSADG